MIKSKLMMIICAFMTFINAYAMRPNERNGGNSNKQYDILLINSNLITPNAESKQLKKSLDSTIKQIDILVNVFAPGVDVMSKAAEELMCSAINIAKNKYELLDDHTLLKVAILYVASYLAKPKQCTSEQLLACQKVINNRKVKMQPLVQKAVQYIKQESCSAFLVSGIDSLNDIIK